MEVPVVSEDSIKNLRDLQRENPEREVVGYLEVEEENGIALVKTTTVVAHGDDDKVAYREHRPYVFHTHPPNFHGHWEPPSGEDYLQSLSWGYPDYNADKKFSRAELVVSTEGFWWYTSRPELREFYYSLQDSDEQRQCDFKKATMRYLTAVVVCFQNKLISLEKMTCLVEILQFSWLAKLLRQNGGLLEYLKTEFPLESMHKLCEVELPDVAGFFLVFLEMCF